MISAQIIIIRIRSESSFSSLIFSQIGRSIISGKIDIRPSQSNE